MKSSEAVAQKCSVKKLFLEIAQNSQENNSCGCFWKFFSFRPSFTLPKKKQVFNVSFMGNFFCINIISFLAFDVVSGYHETFYSKIQKCEKFRSSHPEAFLGKCVLKICSKFTVDHPCRSVISKKLQSSLLKSHSGMGFLR